MFHFDARSCINVGIYYGPPFLNPTTFNSYQLMQIRCLNWIIMKLNSFVSQTP